MANESSRCLDGLWSSSRTETDMFNLEAGCLRHRDSPPPHPHTWTQIFLAQKADRPADLGTDRNTELHSHDGTLRSKWRDVLHFSPGSSFSISSLLGVKFPHNEAQNASILANASMSTPRLNLTTKPREQFDSSFASSRLLKFRPCHCFRWTPAARRWSQLSCSPWANRSIQRG